MSTLVRRECKCKLVQLWEEGDSAASKASTSVCVLVDPARTLQPEEKRNSGPKGRSESVNCSASQEDNARVLAVLRSPAPTESKATLLATLCGEHKRALSTGSFAPDAAHLLVFHPLVLLLAKLSGLLPEPIGQNNPILVDFPGLGFSPAGLTVLT